MVSPAPLPLCEKLASLRELDRGRRWHDVGEVGRIRLWTTRQGKVRYLVDLRPYGRIYTAPGVGALETERDAQRVLLHVQGELAKGKAIEEILETYLPRRSKRHLFESKMAAWLDALRTAVDSGDRSPGYVRELERYCKVGGHFEFWRERSVFEVDSGSVRDFNRWLRTRGISAKTRKNVIWAFRALLGWLEFRDIPPMPRVPVDEYSPMVVTMKAQEAILRAIPADERGIFMAMAYMGLRPSEARALNVSDYRDGYLVVERGIKGPHQRSPVRGTKTRKARQLPMDTELASWLDCRISKADRLRGLGPLFKNPRAWKGERRWTLKCLARAWRHGCEQVGIRVKLYEGTKHSFATAALRRGVPEIAIQRFLGHTDVRSTRRYARLADEALVSVLRPRWSSDGQIQSDPDEWNS